MYARIVCHYFLLPAPRSMRPTSSASMLPTRPCTAMRAASPRSARRYFFLAGCPTTATVLLLFDRSCVIAYRRCSLYATFWRALWPFHEHRPNPDPVASPQRSTPFAAAKPLWPAAIRQQPPHVLGALLVSNSLSVPPVPTVVVAMAMLGSGWGASVLFYTHLPPFP